MNEETLKRIIARVLDNANDALNEEKSEFVDGKKLAYYEVLDTIKNELKINDADLKEFGLDINLDSKYI